MSEKLLEIYPVRITPTLQHNIKKLTKQEVDQMLDEIRNLMSRHVHNSNAFFNPKIYQDETEV